MLPRFLSIRSFQVANRKLQLLGQAYVPISYNFSRLRIACPNNVVDAVDILQKCRNTLEPIGQLGTDRIQVHAPALLEISELCDLESIEHHLPADPPRAQRGRFTVVFLELDVVLAGVNTDGGQRLQVKLLHILL